MFEPKGRLVLAASTQSEEELLDIAVEAGADDLGRDGDEVVVLTEPDLLDQVRQAFEQHGISVEEAELVRLPKTTVPVQGHDAETLMELLDLLEEHDDVQHVYSNADLPDNFLEA
jgi:transcriptional/translational regulatory protein YebC/TACO1